MPHEAIILTVIGIFAYALASRKIEQSILTLPMLFAGLGFFLGGAGMGILPMGLDHGAVHILAEVTLVLVLFSDASRIDLRRLISDHAIPVRMLVFGLPLTLLFGAMVVFLIFPSTPLAVAFLTAAFLTPTDAALGQAVVSNERVPVRIRQALNAESGLNDGIVLPVVMLCAIWAGAKTSIGESPSEIATFAALQVTLGPLAGVVVGYVGARLIDAAVGKGWIGEPFQGIAILCVVVLCYVGAETIGGNGFIAAFVGGLVFGHTVQERCNFLFEFMEGEGQLLTLLTFFVFGAVLLPVAIPHMNWGTISIALLFLTVVRMLPVALSLAGLGLSMPTLLFLGWFGPRGLASILFALLILEESHLAQGSELLACVVMTVGLSILLHGVTANPLAKYYAKHVEKTDTENQPVEQSVMRGEG